MSLGNCPVNFSVLGARLQQGTSAGTRGAGGAHTQSSLLLLLDFNGVLVHRLNKNDRVENRLARQHRPPWKSSKHHHLWKRPYLRQFLDIATTKYTVGIWSAAEERTVLPIISDLSRDLQLTPPLMRRLSYLRFRSSCRPDPQSGKYAVVKYLPDVWSSVPFSESNTLIIDDTFEKVRHYPSSAVVIPEYAASKFPESYNFDDTLLWLLLYVEYLALTAESGASSIAQIRPFLMSFEAFCNLGRLRASNLVPFEQRHRTASLALAFFPKPDVLHREPSRTREESLAANPVLSGYSR